jgi:hypothetical protein
MHTRPHRRVNPHEGLMALPESCFPETRCASYRMQGVQCIGRSAYFAQRSQHPRSLQGLQSSHDCFAEAARLSDPPFEAVEVPYEGATLPGYFFRVDDSGERRPTVITMTGMDGYVEECYWGVAALERGYNCLAFDGPGQGGVLRQREVPFRPDWEAVVTPFWTSLLRCPRWTQSAWSS